MIGTRGLDRALDSFSARISKKDGVSKGCVDKALRKGFTLWAAIEVGHVHQRCRLILNCFGEVRMAVAKQVDSNACSEIQRAAAVFRNQPSAFTANRPKSTPRIDWHQGRYCHDFLPSDQIFGIFQKPKSGPLGPLVSTLLL